MDHEAIQNAISAYCLGVLDQDEQQAVESHLAAGCDACEHLLAKMQEVVGALPFSAMPVAPPAQLKDRLVAEIRPDGEPVIAPHAATGGQQDTLIDRLERQLRNWRRIGWGLAAGLAMAVIGFVWYTRGLQNELQTLSSRIEISETVIRELRIELDEKQEILNVIKQPRIQIVDLNGQPVSPDAIGRVFVALDDSQAVFVAQNLPQPAQDKDYQLWMLEGTTPVDAGIAEAQQDGTYLLRFPLTPSPQNISAYAITLEPKGGVPQPTGAMYLVGAVSGD